MNIQVVELNFLWITLGIMGVITLAVILFLIVFQQDAKDHFTAIQQRLNYGFVYRLDLKLGKVEEYDMRKRRRVKTYLMDDFMRFYRPEQRDELTLWLTRLLKQQSDVPWTFQTHLIKDKRQQQQVIFEVNFEFKNFIHQKIAETFYPLIENKMIESFRKRANSLLD